MLNHPFSITKLSLCQPPDVVAYATKNLHILGRQAPLISSKLNT
jgi:hypothetical protein